MNSLFTYTDYRLYLKDFYNQKKSFNHRYSYQVMAQQMGFKSKGFIYRVIKGQKSLSAAGIASVSIGLGHGAEESLYFSVLVNFNQAKTAQEKDFYYKQLNVKFDDSSANKGIQKLYKKHFELFAEWYHLAIRALIEMSQFKDDFDWLARQLQPAISKKQARSSITLLEKLNLIEKNANNIYVVTEKGLFTNSEVDSLSLVRFYQSCFKLSSEALNKIPKSQRNVSGVTLGISKKSYDEIVDELTFFRKKVGEIARQDDNPEHVYQMQLSLFPFSNLDRGRNQ